MKMTSQYGSYSKRRFLIELLSATLAQGIRQHAHESLGLKFWVDLKGRRTAVSNASPLAHVEGQNIGDAMAKVSPEIAKLERDFALKFLLDPWSDQGWVSPDGRFYGCRFYGHDEIAYALLRKSPFTLEDEGWLRVHSDSFRQGETTRQSLTSLQERTILALGFEDATPGSRRTAMFTIDRKQPAPSYAVKPPTRIIEKHSEKNRTSAPGASATDLSDILAMLASHPEFGAAFEGSREEIPDVGPGIWLWMVRFDDFDIGSDLPPNEVMSEEGIHLRATSFDTIEAAPWPFAGIEISQEAREILEKAIERSSSRSHRISAVVP